ncbi:MAG: polysaccharide biosynthesis C-terminal domain-containing protein, partial [Burkholderiales bacterium]|nr:polysaccharide biosynthesis C-terminal domain-containing protein [Anaerolineae bacterium]
SVVALLQMTAFEGDVMQASVISAVLNLVLSWILISRYGIEGAALATTLSLIVRRWLLSRSVRNRLHINPSVSIFR